MFKSFVTFVFCAMCLTLSNAAFASDNSSIHSDNPQHKMVSSSCSR